MERRRTRRYHHREKTWMEKFKDYLRQFIAFLFSNVGIIGLVVGYTITGAFIFIFIEKKEVSEGNIIVMKLRNETVDFLWNLTYVLNVFDEPHWKTAVSMKLMDYQEEVVKAISKGFDGSDNNLGGSQWSFSGAFLYSLTVITTIVIPELHLGPVRWVECSNYSACVSPHLKGDSLVLAAPELRYGNVTPRTEWGKLATILYAIIGMPLFLLYLSNIGDVLAKSFKWTYAKCFLCKGCTRREIPERHRRLKRVQHSMQIAYNESPPEPSFRSFSIREDWQVRHVIGEDDVVAIRVEQDSRGQDTEDDDSDGGEDSDDEDSENEEGLDEEYDPQTVTVPLTLCLAIMTSDKYRTTDDRDMSDSALRSCRVGMRRGPFLDDISRLSSCHMCDKNQGTLLHQGCASQVPPIVIQEGQMELQYAPHLENPHGRPELQPNAPRSLEWQIIFPGVIKRNDIFPIEM
ncbi:unnamed protein product [Timema podura]|uniref:Potassium channel domain-containing protein n=1 Tax=Timema podura TaxID=61482 RepID=A0ABN7NG23_TIMPD|nr:unnamed protein product [Timema podura]